MVNPNVLSNIPEEQHPTQQRRVQQLMDYLNQSLLQNDLFSAYIVQRVLHKELLTDEVKETLEMYRQYAATTYSEEKNRHNNGQRFYSPKFQQHLEKWELELRKIAQKRGLM